MAGIDDLGNFDVSGAVNSFTGGAYSIVMVLLTLLVVGAIGIAIWYVLQFKHRVIIKVMTKESSYVVQDKAREIVEEGVKYWYLLKRREVVTIPPPEATHMTMGGKFIAEAYWSDESGLVWAEDTVTRENFSAKKVTPGANGSKQIKDAFQPFTTQERALMAARIVRAQTRKKKNLLETITALATPLVLVVLVICILMFWEDIAKPAKEMSELNLKVTAENAKISEQNARMLSALRPDLNIPVTQTVTAGGTT